MKPVLKRVGHPLPDDLHAIASGNYEIVFGWICQSPSDPEDLYSSQNRFEQRWVTWASTPREAWRQWFRSTRKRAAGMIDDALMLPPMRMKNHSELARKTLGLIEHDRYLLKVDSRQSGGKGRP